jgi:hypothetical protein
MPPSGAVFTGGGSFHKGALAITLECGNHAADFTAASHALAEIAAKGITVNDALARRAVSATWQTLVTDPFNGISGGQNKPLLGQETGACGDHLRLGLHPSPAARYEYSQRVRA